MGTSHVDVSPPICLHFTLVTSLEGLSQIQSRSESVGVRASTVEFGEDTILRITELHVRLSNLHVLSFTIKQDLERRILWLNFFLLKI